jgi:hypothetical protein
MASQFDFVRGMMSVMKSVVNSVGAGSPATFPKLPAQDWVELPPVPPCVIADGFEDAFREQNGALLVSHYADGTVRRENVDSGVIEEVRGDGSMIVSLPDGMILRQAFDGAPLLALDLERSAPPSLARVVQAPIEDAPSAVYHYTVPSAGHYIVELSTLRHFQVLDTAFFAGR